MDRSPLTATGWLLAAALIAFRLLPGLLQPGMFFDGVTHATIARNLAIGVGDPWHPVFSTADGAGYHEQPPLGFVLESFFFRAFGDRFWVEKLYSALTGVVTAVLIATIWRRLVGESALTPTLSQREREMRDCAWLPVALWVILPGWGWMYENNLLENTLGMFAAFAVYALLRAADSGRAAPAWLAAGAAGIAAAVLSKGPVGLFPLVTPLVAYCTLKRRTLARAVAENAALVALVAAALWLICLLPGAADYLDKYLHEQLFASLRGQREVVGSALGRFDIVWKMLKELILPTTVAGGLIWGARRGVVRSRESIPSASTSVHGGEAASNSLPLPLGEGRGEGATANRSALAFCLLTAASASFPIVASPKQSGHYAFPSYAFYALAIALWCAPAVIQWMAGAGKPAAMIRRHRLLRYAAASVLALLGIATCAMAGRPHRDQGVYHDALVLGKILPKSSIVGLTDDLANDWPLQTNLARWDFIGADLAAAHPYLLATAAAPPPTGFAEVPTEMSRYRLFKRAVDPGSIDSLRETAAPPIPRQ
ncbi:MAG TPA: glycosyltransferase family 39 protein [Pirellulales bacterium]|nr:glycosyltransferase family 39 protein [Pirellulales bacterium]